MALTDYKITETERDTLGITTANDQYINQAGTIKARFDALPKTIVNKYNSLIDFLGSGYQTVSVVDLTPTKYVTLDTSDAKDLRVSKCGKHCVLDINARWAGADNSVRQKTFYTVATLPSGYRPKNNVYFGLTIKMVTGFISVVGKLTTAGEVQIAQESNTPTNLLVVGNASYFTEE